MLCTVGFSEDLVKVDIKKLKKIYTSEIKSAFKNKVMTGYYDPDGGEKIYFTWIYDSNGDYFAESDFTGKVSGEWNVDTDKLCFKHYERATAGADEEFLCSFVYTKYGMVYYLLNDSVQNYPFAKITSSANLK